MTVSAWYKTTRYVSSCGGTRSGKTFSWLQWLICLANKATEPVIISVVSETYPHLRRGAIRDFTTILGTSFRDDCWNKSDSTYTFPNGSIIEFFSADSPAKVHGPARDYLLLNEAQNIPYEVARQLFVRTREKIAIDYNPTHSFWLNEKVESQPNCVTIHSTYLDNVDSTTGESFLSDNQRAEIESNKSDKNWWRVYGLGLAGQLDGLIYDFELIDSLPEHDEMSSLTEIQGLDFGFTNDPTARVQVLADHKRKIAYIRERCYKTHMQNKHIIEDLKADNITSRTEIFADCAEPKSIADIRDAGFRVTACDKDAPVRSDKLKFQLQWMQGWKLMVTKDSLNLINELRNYTWEKDRDGNSLNYPIDKFNHLLDALRYALWTKYGKKAGQGQYNISIR